jgi:hypothetical protein
MTEQKSERGEAKTCLNCGGTWPSDRRNCLACGANLESVPARPASEDQGQQPFDWTWLDAMAEEGPHSGTAEPVAGEEKSGCLARILGTG